MHLSCQDTVLWKAAQRGCTRVVSDELEKIVLGFDCNEASKSGRKEQLFTSQARLYSALTIASRNNHVAAVQELLAAGALSGASEYTFVYEGTTRHLSALCIAARAGSRDCVISLLKVKAFGARFALYLAVRDAHKDVLLAIIEGAPTCDGAAQVRWRDLLGRTPLHYAARFNRAKMVPILASTKADVDALANGFTALHLAKLHKHTSVVAALLRAKASVDISQPPYAPGCIFDAEESWDYAYM